MQDSTNAEHMGQVPTSEQPMGQVPSAQGVEIYDEMSVDGVFRRYGQRRDSSGIEPAREAWANANPFAPKFPVPAAVLDVEHPEFDLGRTMQYLNEGMRELGWESSLQTITFSDVSVTVEQKDSYIPTYWSTLYHALRSPYSAIREPPQQFTKVDRVSGYCKPGEMLLVLGPPGSGCSTLLRVLSGRRAGYNVSGKILYNGSPDYKNLHINLIGEDDQHLASLTVEQTLTFAAELCTALAAPTRQDLSREVKLTLHMLGLYRVKDTVVGDSLLRGVSGGEKKRVTIGEMALAGRRSRIMCMDGWSKGLDSAAALDICKAVRVVTNQMQQCTIMSQYQASVEMFDIFDNVLLMDMGRQVYFGPAKGALQYFDLLGIKCPPRRTIPDFLATVVDNAASLAAEGTSPPTTAEAFSAAFYASSAGREMQQEIEKSAQAESSAHAMCAEAKAATAADYATPFLYQLKLLVKRETVLILNNKPVFVYPRVMQSLFMSLVLGALFFDLPLDRGGAYSRSGLLFQSLMYIGMSAFSSLPSLLQQRTVFAKQRDAQFFHPMAWFISKTLADLPLATSDVLIFGSITYWMAGFYSSAPRFFFFLLVLWMTTVSMSNFIRLCGCVSQNLSAAQGLGAATVVVFVFFSGFMIPKDSIPKYWIWAYWLSPLQYPLHALMINEYYPLTFHCSPSELTPSVALLKSLGVNGSFGDYQLCPISGYPTGPRTGRGYLEVAFSISGSEGKEWIDVIAQVGWLCAYLLGAAIALSKMNFLGGGSNLRFKEQKQEKNPEAVVHVVSAAPNPLDPNAHAEQYVSSTELSRRDYGGCKAAYLTWNHLSYEVFKQPQGSGFGRRRNDQETLRLLEEVHGYCTPRSMIALMGSSGAGKTTLLDVLAMRKTGGRIAGDIKVNGVRQDGSFMRIAGYVEQEDNHSAMCTVREALLFSARLRLPVGTGEEKIQATVESTIDLLNLRRLADALIGDQLSGGIPLEARKRVTIGVELVANPSILFLDEPTSGLDTRGALTVMTATRRIADSGRAVICTIHQPSAELFEMFDSLLLLARGGKTVYFGPIGANSETLLAYFERHGAEPCPQHANPAEYILEVIGGGISRQRTANMPDWPALWQRSPEFHEMYQKKDQLVPTEATPFVLGTPESTLQFHGIREQFRHVLARTAWSFWRTPSYNLVRHLFAVGVGLLFGSAYFQLGSTQANLQQHVACLFFTIFLAAMAMMNAMTPLFTDRPVFLREVANGSYARRIYAMSISLVEMPFALGATILFINIFYWMVGMPAKFDRYIFAIFDYFALQIFSTFLGQAIAALSPSLQTALGVTPVLMSLWMLHVGFTIPEPSIPGYFKVFNIVNPYKYFMRSFVSSALHGHVFHCEESEYLTFPRPPKGCPEISNGQWVNTASHCRLCPTINGDDFLTFYSWKFSTRWTDLIILLVCAAAFWAITFVAIEKRQYSTR